MKVFLTIFFFLLSSSLVAEKKISNFSYLYEHPNSHYFFTCGVGKIDIFGGSSCGSYLGDEYIKLIKELKKVTGLKKINLEIYENIEILDKKRLKLIQSTEVDFDSFTIKIKKQEDKFESNCKTYPKYFGINSKDCIEYKNNENSNIQKINNLGQNLSKLINESKLNNPHLSLGLSFITI